MKHTIRLVHLVHHRMATSRRTYNDELYYVGKDPTVRRFKDGKVSMVEVELETSDIAAIRLAILANKCRPRQCDCGEPALKQNNSKEWVCLNCEKLDQEYVRRRSSGLLQSYIGSFIPAHKIHCAI